jgi:hypothetical protein
MLLSPHHFHPVFTVNFGASLEKNISVPKSTGFRMMASIDYAKWLAKNKNEDGRSARVLEVLLDTKEGGALDQAKAAVVAKLTKLIAEKKLRDTRCANWVIAALCVLFISGAGWNYYTNNLAVTKEPLQMSEL